MSISQTNRIQKTQAQKKIRARQKQQRKLRKKKNLRPKILKILQPVHRMSNHQVAR
jgi:hypothetical protein